jgi:hypothetical protein
VIQGPVIDPAGTGIESPEGRFPDAAPRAVDPVQTALLDVPDRALAKMIFTLKNTLDFDRHSFPHLITKKFLLFFPFNTRYAPKNIFHHFFAR